jgi:hypothetical protein
MMDLLLRPVQLPKINLLLQIFNKCASGSLLLKVTMGLLSKPNSVMIDEVSDTITSTDYNIEESSEVSIT